MDLESSFDLIQLAQGGDSIALERLLERYRPRLQRWASGRLPRFARGMTDTEDLVQEAMIGTFRNFTEFDCRGEWALQAYLRRAITNRIRDELRRAAVQPRRVEFVELPAAEMSPLEDVEREAVIARLELGCSYQEIAALGEKSSADAARMMVARAVAKLARLMG